MYLMNVWDGHTGKYLTRGQELRVLVLRILEIPV